MPEMIALQINGKLVEVAGGTSVAVALLLADQPSRLSITGEMRGPLCGMGICFECRAMVNGRQHQRTCQLPCMAGMTVETNP